MKARFEEFQYPAQDLLAWKWHSSNVNHLSPPVHAGFLLTHFFVLTDSFPVFDLLRNWTSASQLTALCCFFYFSTK